MDNMFTDISSNTTAYGVTDAPPPIAVATNEQRPYNYPTVYSIAGRSLSGRTFNLANWNVRTTNDSDNSVRLERVTAIICRELERAVIEICALTEVRRPKSGNIVEKSHTIFWSGGQDKNACVGFAVSNKLENITPQPINDRLITCRIDLQNGNFLTLVSAYTPTMQRTVEEKELFYENLGECMRRAKDDSIFILGDFNPRVCDDC